MNGILKKNNEIYSLLVNGVEFAFYDKNRTERPLNSLSIKNCEAIADGYDLDELGMDYASTIYDGRTELTRFNGAKVDFTKGFQKALEILGDKKFSEEDFKSFAQNYYREIRENKSNLLWSQLADKCLEEHIKSQQQTEWEVEIKQVNQLNLDSGKFEWKPILDADGCLILKRKV